MHDVCPRALSCDVTLILNGASTEVLHEGLVNYSHLLTGSGA